MSQNWYAWDLYHSDQFEIKIMNKNLIWSFCFGLKYWSQLEKQQNFIIFSNKKHIFS